MSIDWTTVVILGVIFIATVIRSAFGFGEALIAVPLLALVMPVEVAAPLAVLVSITVAVAIVVQDWHKVHLPTTAKLVISSLFGIPVGVWLLVMVAEPIVKAILAVVILLFSGYCLVRPMTFELKDDRFAWFFGFVAGALGGAYGMNGPPLVIYGALRRWSPEFFRATLQGYFLPASLVGMLGYWLTDLWDWQVTYHYLLALPVVAIAIVLGRWIHWRIKDQRFLRYVHIGLVVIGLILLVQAMWKFKSQS